MGTWAVLNDNLKIETPSFGKYKQEPSQGEHCPTVVSLVGVLCLEVVMKKIPLTRGKFALVDDEDYLKLIDHKWYATKGYGTYYADATIKITKGKYRHTGMHREILGLKHRDGKLADHINGNGLDNQKHNLRVCTFSENQHNKAIQINNTTGYKGVVWNKEKRKYVARIKINRKTIFLGYFKEVVEAGLAFNNAAIKYHKSVE